MAQIKKSGRFDQALLIDRIHYFPNTLKPSDIREGKPYEVTVVYFRDKWRQDIHYITEDFMNILLENRKLLNV